MPDASPVDLKASFDKPPAAAIDYLKNKKITPTFDYTEVQGRTHDHAFVVAHMTQMDLLEDVRTSLVTALEEGQDFKTWQANIEPIMREKGWWGKRIIVDGDGNAKNVQLGSPRRLRTIFNTNIGMAYQKGREVNGDYDIFPFAVWHSRLYGKYRREAHKQLHGEWFRRDDPYFQSIQPRKAYGCQCDLIVKTARQAERAGAKIHDDLSPYVTTEEVIIGGRTSPARLATVNTLRLPDKLPYKTDAGWTHANDAIPMQAMLDKASVTEPRLASKSVTKVLARESVQERFNSDVKKWINSADLERPKGEFRHVGVIPEPFIDVLKEKDVNIDSSVITVHDNLTLKHLNKERKQHDHTYLENIANVLSGFQQLYWDVKDDRPAFITYHNGSIYRIAIKFDKTKFKGYDAVGKRFNKVPMNILRTIVVDRIENIENGSNYVLLAEYDGHK